MRRYPRAVFILILLFAALMSAGAQRLYWGDPFALEQRDSRFPKAVAGGGLIVIVWQEFSTSGIYLSMRTSRDLETWSVKRRFAGPYSYQEIGSFKTPEPTIFAMDVDDAGRIYIVVAGTADRFNLLYSEDEGETFSESALESDTTLISPRLYARDYDRGVLLLAVRRTEELESQNLYFTTLERSDFRRARIRISLEPLVENENLVSNFLPHYASFQGREYLAYQSEDAGKGYPNQIYLKISDESGDFRTADPPVPITTYQVDREGLTVSFPQFENWRPFLFAMEDRLALAWERSFLGEPYQIYYVELKADGSFYEETETDTFGNAFGPFVRVSDERYTCHFPRVFVYRGTTYLLWFDNRRGDNHIIISEKDESRWRDSDISRNLEGSSVFPWVVQSGELFSLFWENQYQEQSRLYSIILDQEVNQPRLLAGSFTPGRPSRSSDVRFRWTIPADPSGIAGFTYSWSRDPEPQLEYRLMLGGDSTGTVLAADEDGSWYFHLAAQDFAENWSEPVSLRYIRDTLPPPPVVFVDMETDEGGYLISNDLSIAWNEVAEDTVSGYTFRLTQISEDAAADIPEEIQPGSPAPRVLTQQLTQNYRNVDNGVWAFTAAAIDVAGNLGELESVVFRLNKYQPVTLIYSVASVFDDFGAISFNIGGRGFTSGGIIQRVILDQDGKEPYDYVFQQKNGDFTIANDRSIVGPSMTLFDEGVYRLALEHSVRGIEYYDRSLELSPLGTVKWGDYSAGYVPPWQKRRKPLFVLPINMLYAGVVLLFVAFAFLASVTKLVGVAREGRKLRREVMVLLTGPVSPERKEALMKEIRRRGLGLRFKFAALVTILVILIVLPLSVYFGFNLINNQTENLADGLWKNARLMVGSMSSGSVEGFLENDTFALRNVADQKVSMDEALHATITSVVPKEGQDLPSEAGGVEYVWATNDQSITGSGGFVAGMYQLPVDDVSPQLAELTDRLNEKAQASVEERVQAYESNLEEFRILILRSDAESQARLDEIDRENVILQNEIRSILQQTAAEEFGSIPAFELRNLEREYTFYMPVAYYSAGKYFYYRGLIRMRVTAEEIIQAISDTQRRLFINSALFALGAIVLGLLGAMLLSAITINPIKKLVSGVALIRDTEDKEDLKSHTIDIKQRDELRILADTVNEMTQGLVAAAIAAKDLTVGKEIQKMFIPLELDARGQKATAGGETTEKVEIFGYYEGAKGVSGDYFEYKKLDNQHYAVIKCDVAGKGVPAALIMVEVATIFLTYFRNWTIKSPGLKIDGLAYMINDMLEERGFRGRFAALIIGIINVETGAGYLCNAGDNIVNIYDGRQRRMIQKTLPETAAAGVFPSMLLETKGGFVTVPVKLSSGDTLLLYTDGVFEAQRILRDAGYSALSWQDVSDKGWDIRADNSGEATGANAFEELGEQRIGEAQNAVFNRRTFKLEKYRSPNPDEELVFDFSSCKGTVEEAVLAMIAVEKIFRVYTDPSATEEDTINMDRRVDAFLEQHFVQYSLFFSSRVDKDPDSPYVSFGYLKEDGQYDDLTILGIRLL